LLPQNSDYADIASEYKNWAKNSPFYDTIDEKINRQPKLQNITRTGIALHGQHWGTLLNPWNTFTNSIDAMKSLKSMYGVTHAVIHETKWRKDHSGEIWDDYYPEYTPPSSIRGGASDYQFWAQWLDKNGYILLPHTDSAIWDDRGTEYYSNSYRALDYGGNPKREQYWSTSSWFMSQYAIKNIEETITNNILGLGANGRFLDMLGRGITMYGEDYNSAIPSNYQPYGKIYGTKVFLDQLNSTGAVLGTEAFVEPLIPYIPYVSGRMWLPDDTQQNSFGFRHDGETRYGQVPLWSLVYHEFSYISDHDLLEYSGIDTYNSTSPNDNYGKMTRLTNVENGAMMMIDTLSITNYNQLAKDIVDYQKEYYHEIYNAELIDHYYINSGIDWEDPRTWTVAVSVFKNPNNEYIISICNYGSTTHSPSFYDDNLGDIETAPISPKDWYTFISGTIQDDLKISYNVSSNNIGSDDRLIVNISIKNYLNASIDNARIELIIGVQTFTKYSDSQGNANFDVNPSDLGTYIVEIVAIKSGYDFKSVTFSLTITPPQSTIPGFQVYLILFELFGIIIIILKKRETK
jgi:hypothetical protein